MIIFQFMQGAKKLAVVATGILLAVALSGQVMAKDELPEVSSDGLHLVKDSKVAVAYAKQGIDLTQFNKVKILDCYVAFKENWARDYNLNEVGLSGRVNDKDMDAIKGRLANAFKEVFEEQLTEAGHEVVEEGGPGVLLLRPAIINLDVNAPDIMKASRGNTWVNSVGEMTLYLELYDAEDNTLLARAIDPKAGRNGGMATRANRASNSAEAKRILRQWADQLASHLGEVKQQTGG